MLLNRLVERGRELAWRRLLLARRMRAVGERTPVVLVPGMCGTRLVDEQGRVVWGSLARLYAGPSITTATRSAGLLESIEVIPGVAGVDVYGGLVRFLERAGYRRGEDLFVLDYDWRTGALDGAGALARALAAIRGVGDERVDVIALSTGGIVTRAYLAEHGAAAIRRVVYVGAPQRGSFDALACLHRGFRFAPGGRRFAPSEAAALQISFDALPHPDERVFVDNAGNTLELDLYDPATWMRLGMTAAPGDLAARLESARALHRRLDGTRLDVDTFVIGACHLPTPARVRVEGGRAHVPPPHPSRTDPFVGYTYVPGDGELAASSLCAVPGLDPQRVWFVTPGKHSGLVSDPEVHRLALEALVGTARTIPKTDLRKLTVLRQVSAAAPRVASSTP
jgi:hypothetical protein